MYNVVGVTPAIYVNSSSLPKPRTINKRKDYLLIQVESAQAAFRGKPWNNVRKFVVLSKVNLNITSGSKFSEVINQELYNVQPNACNKLGFSNKTLVPHVPASMDNISITFDFLTDVESKLKQFADLINTQAAKDLFSLTPVGAYANAGSKVIQAIQNTYWLGITNNPILSFKGEFDIQAKELNEGYYAIISATDEHSPLPPGNPELIFNANNDLCLVGNAGYDLSRWCYILLHVHYLGNTRDIEDGKGRSWYKLYETAQHIAKNVENRTWLSRPERVEAFYSCQIVLDDMVNLLKDDPDYLESDSNSIYITTLATLKNKIYGDQTAEMAEHFPENHSETARNIFESQGITDRRTLNLALANYETNVRLSANLKSAI
jgi:hypothetical protein